MLFVALVIPAAYHSAKTRGGIDDGDGLLRNLQIVDGSDLDDRANYGLKIISRGTAILLLLVYIAYLRFQVKAHV